MKIVIKDDAIRLGQLLKKIQIISSGGEAKWYVAHNEIKINGQKPAGRNAKVPVGAVVWINDEIYQVVAEFE